MKRITLLLAALLLSLSALAQNGKSIYQKYSDAEQVSAVYIPPPTVQAGPPPAAELGVGVFTKRHRTGAVGCLVAPDRA